VDGSHIFMKSYNEGFLPEVKKYTEELELEYKVLLRKCSASSHFKSASYENVKLVLLPENLATSISSVIVYKGHITLSGI
jgi:hypothetical protein